MTSAYTSSRYAIWNHSSQLVQDPIDWRTTPKSKDVVALVAPARLTGYAQVVGTATKSCIKLKLSAKQVDEIAHWTSMLPDNVIRTTAEQDGVISHEGQYVCLDSAYCATERWPSAGQWVAVRVVPEVVRVGSLRKAQLRVTDVFQPDIAAE